MSDEVTETTTNSVKKTSDGMVKVSLEKYHELVEKATYKPPVINRTIVNKTPEMLREENLIWGNTLMGLGVGSFVVGAFRRWRAKS